MRQRDKPIHSLKNILVFGAGGRLGRAATHHLHRLSLATRLRLATSRIDIAPVLQNDNPQDEVIVVNFTDPESMRFCFDGIDATFLVTPNFLDEVAAMPIFIKFASQNSRLRQIIRIVGDMPDARLDAVPQKLKDYGPGPATQHILARQILDSSGLPVTYLNLTGALMDNLFANAPSIIAQDALIQPERTHGFVDTSDVGEVAARLLLSGDDQHIRKSYKLNNGNDLLPWSSVAVLMSSVLSRSITHDGSDTSFLKHIGPLYNRKMGFDWADAYFLDYFKNESKYDLAWELSGFAETILGRKPKTLRAWLEQNKAAFCRPA